MKKAFAGEWHWSDGYLLSVSHSPISSPGAWYGVLKCVNDYTCTYEYRFLRITQKHCFKSCTQVDQSYQSYYSLFWKHCLLSAMSQTTPLLGKENLGGPVADMFLSDFQPQDAAKFYVRFILETHCIDICRTVGIHNAIPTCGMTSGSGERCMTSPPPVALSARWARRVTSSGGVRYETATPRVPKRPVRPTRCM